MTRAGAWCALAMTLEFALAACVTSTEAKPTTEQGAASLAREFVPLAVGNVWRYRVSPGPDALEEVRIVARDDAGFFLDNHGVKLAPRSDGVFDGDRFVLHDPIALDATWMAVPDPKVVERYRITAVDDVVTVPAGTFAHCVEVQGEQPTRHPTTGQRGTLYITWTYARGVGLVRVKQSVRLDGAPPAVTATMELASYEAAGASAGASPASSSTSDGTAAP